MGRNSYQDRNAETPDEGAYAVGQALTPPSNDLGVPEGASSAMRRFYAKVGGVDGWEAFKSEHLPVTSRKSDSSK